MQSWFQARLARDIRVAHKLWSVRLMVFTILLQGAWVVWPAFQGYVPLWNFVLVCFGLSIATLFARLTGQKAVDNGVQ
jgi:hypothetical protein